jgi:hypothetical protein
MARLTGLEPATPGVTGRYSNRLSYNRAISPASAGSEAVYPRPAPPSSARLNPGRCGGPDGRPGSADHRFTTAVVLIIVAPQPYQGDAQHDLA